MEFKETTSEKGRSAGIRKVLPAGGAKWARRQERANKTKCRFWVVGVGCSEYGPQARCLNCTKYVASERKIKVGKLVMKGV
jgi:hypothetical protein